MSYGAPWERGVGVADTTPLRDLEAPGLVPDVDGGGIGNEESSAPSLSTRSAAAATGKEGIGVGRSEAVLGCDVGHNEHCSGRGERAIESYWTHARRGWRGEISAARRWAEAEVAVANARVDALEEMIKESRSDELSIRVCALEDTGVADSVGRVVRDCGAGSRNGAELATAHYAAVQSSTLMVQDSMQVDDVGRGVVMTDASAVFGDYGVMIDVVGGCQLANVLQEQDGTGGLRASSRCAVQDVAVGSTGGAASIGEAVPCGSGIDVVWPSVDGLGDGDMDEQDAGTSLAFGVSCGAMEEPAEWGEGSRRDRW